MLKVTFRDKGIEFVIDIHSTCNVIFYILSACLKEFRDVIFSTVTDSLCTVSAKHSLSRGSFITSDRIQGEFSHQHILLSHTCAHESRTVYERLSEDAMLKSLWVW